MQLTREPLLDYGDGVRRRDFLSVYLRKEYEGHPHVHLGHNDDPGVEMTLAEVRELRDHLTAVLVEAGPAL